MFRRKKEMQSLINSSRKSLAEAETLIEQRDKFLKETMIENKERKELISKIKHLVESNNYNRPDIILNKVKELVRPLNPTNSK